MSVQNFLAIKIFQSSNPSLKVVNAATDNNKLIPVPVILTMTNLFVMVHLLSTVLAGVLDKNITNLQRLVCNQFDVTSNRNNHICKPINL